MKNIFKIIALSKPLHPLLYIIAVLILVSSLLELVTPILSKFIVDEIVAKVSGHAGDINKLIVLLALSFVASLAGIALSGVSERLGDHFAGKLRQFLTEKFYTKVLTLPQSYFDGEISGKIINQLSRGIFVIQNFLNTSTNFILPTFLQSIFTIIVLAYYNIPTALFVAALFPIYLSLSYYSTKKWGKYEVEKNELEDISRGRIQEVVSNIKLVKSFNNEKTEFKFISSKLGRINQIFAVQSRNFHIFDFARNLSLILILLMVNVIVFISTFNGSLTIGEMVLILQLVAQARRPLFAMSFILTQIQQAENGAKEFLEILESESNEDFDEKYSTVKIQNPTIEFRSLSFSYAKDPVLADVSFKINKGEKIALVGESGAGKSTIVSLILKFYQPTKGEIFLKNKAYSDLSPKYIRNNIALVFQENELLSSTVKENVAYGANNPTDAQIKAALKKANAYDFVMKLPEGLETNIGERGIKLSGGQKQRVQIARAILKDAPILILDEATSSLDAKSERQVQDALENLMKDRLVIIIAHRFSTIQNVDKVVVIEDGKVAAQGNPKELSTKPGIYSDLLHYQIEGNRKLLKEFEITG